MLRRPALVIIAVLISSAGAMARLGAADTAADAVNVHDLDGAAYQLTLTTKGHPTPAAAGLKAGVTIDFENGKILFDSGDGGVARIAFSAQLITSDTVRITTTMPGELPRPQALATTKTFTYVSANISLSGTIDNGGKGFTGTLTWDEKDDKSHNKVVYTVSGVPPKN